MPKKVRLDVLLVDRNLFESRERARRFIMTGNVLVDEQRIDKAGTAVDSDCNIRLLGSDLPFVSRGGLKLQRAIDVFNLNLDGRVAMDVGASTGGFTDCMVQRGVKKVYAIDVGYGQLDWRLRNDARVVCMERTNIRNVTREIFDDVIDFASIDVSFISLDKVLPPVFDIVTDGADIVALIKPQFEAGRERVGKHGVVRDPAVHIDVIDAVIASARNVGFRVRGLTHSPIKGPEGNIEYLVHLLKGADGVDNVDNFDDVEINVSDVVDLAHVTLKGR